MIATIIIIILYGIDLGIALALHGKPKGDYHFGLSLIAFLIMMALYYAAGLFDKFF